MHRRNDPLLNRFPNLPPMPNIDPNILKQARQESGLSQKELAENLEISQTQVSRYEKDPEAIPAGLFTKWLGMFGLSPSDVLQQDTGTSLRAEPGAPYSDFRKDLDLLSRYVDVQAPESLEDLSSDTGQVGGRIPSSEDLQGRIRELRQKPNVMTAGGFDTGKSYLANTLMGKEVLPTSYTPATRVVTIVRHVEDRPDWQNEDVWLFGEDLWKEDLRKEKPEKHEEETEKGKKDEREYIVDVSRLDREEIDWEARRILAGSHDLLGKYGVHRSEPTEKVKKRLEEAHTAVVYVDAPILKACNIVDLPGFGDRPSGKSDDQKKAETTLPFADLVLYASRAQGHLSGKDIARISTLLQRLPAPERKNESFPTLGSFFMVATHADRNVSDDDVDDIRETSIRRLRQHLQDGVLPRYEKRAGRSVTEDDLREQWFPFWAENEDRSRPLVDRLEEILGEKLPEVRNERDLEVLRDLRDEAHKRCNEGVRIYQNIIEKSARQKRQVEELKEKTAALKEKLQEEREDVHQLIDTLERKSLSRVEDVFYRKFGVDEVEGLIRANFDDKSEAKDRAPALIVENLESEVEEEIDGLNDELVEKVEEYLDSIEKFSPAIDGDDEIGIPFDARGAFAGGLTTAATAGGLAAWAAQLGSLGGYAIVAQGVGTLSALGISISGGAAAVSAWVASVGGPVTLGAAVAGVAGLAGWRLLTTDWQERLAKKIIKHYNDEGLEEEFRSGMKEYWEDTRNAFEAGADAVEEQFRNHLDRLEELSENEEEAREYVEKFQSAQNFYDGMPLG